MSRQAVAALVAVITVLAFRAGQGEAPGVPFVAVRQGVTAHVVDGQRVFISRQGSVVTAFAAASGYEGAVVRWCPFEELFWAPTTGDIFDAEGRLARGPSRRNMAKVHHVLRQDGLLAIDPSRRTAARAGGGTVHEDILQFFERYQNQNVIPGNKRLVFCPNPVT